MVLGLSVFHDESEPPRDWFIVGLLWIPEDRIDSVIGKLRECRQEVRYDGEVHFCKLQGPVERKLLAKRWFELFRNGRFSQCNYHALVIAKRPNVYDGRRFVRGFQAYNRFTAMALRSGFRLYWPDQPSTKITVISDEKARRAAGREGDGIETDNFEHKLKMRFEAYVLERLNGVAPLGGNPASALHVADSVCLQQPRPPRTTN